MKSKQRQKRRAVAEEIPDAEHELVIERVCAIDVAKASGTVCVRSPRERRRVSKVWDVVATTGAVTDLADQLTELGIEKVTVESTSDYWRIWYYLLEAAGLDVQLVNARDVKNVPGRPKTDKLDAVWLAKLTEKGLLRPSFVPPAPIRQLRDYTRLRVDLTRERARYWQRLEKLLEDALIMTVTRFAHPGDLAGRDVQGGEQRGGAVADVVVGLAFGHPDPHRHGGRGAIQGLDLALLIDTEHDRVLQGIQVEPDDVGDLGDQFGIGGEFERLSTPGLDPMVAPHPGHGAVADPQMSREQP